jgi:hypothetical protein
MKIYTLPSAERVRELFDYNSKSGVFTWKMRTSNRIRIGDRTGCTSTTDGYVYIRADGKLYQAHRLAWVWVHGEPPAQFIDHINGDRVDNRIDNLREATRAQNCHNKRMSRVCASGVKGVCLHQKTGKWRAQIHANGKQHFLGLFDTVEAAAVAAKEGRERIHKEFSCHD